MASNIGYETTFILRPDTTDAAHRGLMDKFKGIIQAHGGQLSVTEDWGRRRLAYPIRKESKGHYMYMLFTGNNTLVAELERNMRISEHVIRFMSVKLGDDFDPAKHKRRAMPNNAPEGESSDYGHGHGHGRGHGHHHRDHRDHRDSRERN